jgi:hypothetical protein
MKHQFEHFVCGVCKSDEPDNLWCDVCGAGECVSCFAGTIPAENCK